MSFQHDHKILVASVAAYDRPPASSAALVESCRRQGIELTLVGRGQTYPCHRAKVRIVAEYLRAHPEHRYVLQLDFRDVIWCATLREAFAKYRAFGRAIVASAERTCWPMPSYAETSPDLGTTSRYLNAGVIFAEAPAWLDAWERMCGMERRSGGTPPEIGLAGHHIFDDDQAAWSDLYIRGEADIALDGRSDIFQSLSRLDHHVSTSNRDLLLEGRRVVNRESGTRPCLVHCNGAVPVAPWARYILDSPVVWAGPLIDRLRAEPPDALGDPARVERLLLDLGLHEPVDDDVPIPLLPFSGKGLAIRRRPAEFAAFLAWLAGRPPVRSYVEAGVGSGGAFIATVEFLRRFGPLDLAVGVDPNRPEILLDYASRDQGAHLVRGDRAAAVLGGIAAGSRVDLVLIDALASADPHADWEAARSCARSVALHGIAPGGPASLAALWAEVRAAYPRTWEFVDDGHPPGSWAGLGVVDLALP